MEKNCIDRENKDHLDEGHVKAVFAHLRASLLEFQAHDNFGQRVDKCMEIFAYVMEHYNVLKTHDQLIFHIGHRALEFLADRRLADVHPMCIRILRRIQLESPDVWYVLSEMSEE